MKRNNIKTASVAPHRVFPAAGSAQELLEKYDRESRTRIWEGTPALLVKLTAVLFSLCCMGITLFSLAALEKRLSLFVAFLLVLGYLNYPACQKHVRPNVMPWYDWVLMLAGAGAFLFYCLEYDRLVLVLSSASRMTPLTVIIGIVGILCLMELCRRCVGLPILCIAAALLVYTFALGKPLKLVVFNLFYDTKGVLSTPLKACANFICVFIIFGAFLERTGIAAFFIRLANALVGRYSGGPAKVAVISSALCGMVSGSSVGNTVTTGAVTIPMMKDTGYEPEFAGAVEAAASTGGQIMPPIMGAAAFLMAEYLGIPYAEIAARAILPAVLYFAGIFIAVHLEAKKKNLRGIPADRLPRIGSLLPRVYLLAPLVLLVWLVVTGRHTMAYAAVVSIAAAVIVSSVDRLITDLAADRTRLSSGWLPRLRSFGCRLLESLEAGGKSTVTVGVACCMAGIISGCITTTGLASRLISAVVNFSSGFTGVNPVFIALFLTMLCCIVLGMGVPTTANYCIMASTCAPILTAMGVPALASHFFVFYFGIVADITPPVALAAYAGAAIAGANPMKTGFTATKLAIGAFVVPFIFCLNPAMLFVDTTALQVVGIVLTSLVGIFGLAAALNGFLFRKSSVPVRLLLALGGLLMMVPSLRTDLAGIVLMTAAVAWQKFSLPLRCV